MPVKRLLPRQKTAPLKRRVVAPRQTLVLPSETTGIDADLSHYVTLIYGREGIGKSTWAASFPKALFFSFEPGVKGLDVHEFFSQNGIQPSWSAFIAAGKLLRQRKHAFDTVVIDTADRAYDACADWVCETREIEHVSEDKTGKSDRSGKGWQLLKQNFTSGITDLVTAGFGVVLVSHSKTQSIQSSSGQEFDLIVPTLSGQGMGVARAITDFIFYAEYLRSRNGDLVRVLITEGDELVTAKHRGALPRYLEMPYPGSGFDILQSAFQGKSVGISPSSLAPSRLTAKSATTFLRKDQARKVLKKGGK